jgi:AraC-like DNA-binding protein
MSDIALSTGFSSQSNFSRAFRDVMGMTPGEYLIANGHLLKIATRA